MARTNPNTAYETFNTIKNTAEYPFRVTQSTIPRTNRHAACAEHYPYLTSENTRFTHV